MAGEAGQAPRRVTFRDYVEGALSPTVFLGKWGGRFASGFVGLMFDMFAETVNQAVKARFMDADTFPVDATVPIGNERLMERYPSETDEGYIARLKGAWEAWDRAGTAQGIVDQLATYGAMAEIVRAVGQNWDWDGNAANWSRVWVIVTGHAWERVYWGDGHAWGDGHTWGSTATPDEVSAVRRIIRKWKPGHVVNVFSIIVFEAAQWGADTPPGGTWVEPENRSDAAIYWPG